MSSARCATRGASRVVNRATGSIGRLRAKFGAQLERLEHRVLLANATGIPDPTPPDVTPHNDNGNIITIKWRNREVEVVENEYILKINGVAGPKPDQITAIQKKINAVRRDVPVATHLGPDGVVLVRAPARVTFAQLRDSLDDAPGFSYLEPNFILRANATIPNDPSFSTLYGLHNTGQNGGTVDADIDAPEAWDVARGDGSVVVGIIDTGIDYTHPDLAANMWQNPGEVPGNSIDDDANGYVDDIYGYDFVGANDSNPIDDHYHGTHVAGTIGGVGNNSSGVVGVNWNVKLMAIKFLSASGGGTTADAIESVNYATMMYTLWVTSGGTKGANVRMTSNSWGGGAFSQALMDAIAASAVTPNGGMLFVAAAGNDSSNNDSLPHYPSSYAVPNIIAVAATDRNDAMASFSSYGLTTVDIGAPGVDTYSTSPGNTYRTLSGTSMATPHVSGVAALAWSVSPNATYQQIRDAIYAGGDPVASLSGKTVTGKRLNAFGTLQQLGMMVTSSSPSAGEIVTSAPTSFTIHFSNPYNPASIQAGDLNVNGIPASSFSLTDADSVTFNFSSSPVTAQGAQTMTLAAGAVTRLSDGNNVSAWSSIFRYDAVPMTVTATTPSNGALVSLPIAGIELTFNEPYAPASIHSSDLTLSNGTVTGVTLLNANTVRYLVSGINVEATVSYSLAAGAVSDAFGNPVLAYNGSFATDFGVVAYPVPLDAKSPRGSLIYDPTASGMIGVAGDVDSFSILLDAGQLVSVIVDPAAALQPVVELLGPGGGSLGSASAVAAGKDVLLNSIAATAPGTYTIRVSSAAGTSGAYTVRLIVNAAGEAEEYSGPTNDTMATAQNLDSSFVALGAGSAAVAAVVGRLPSAGGTVPFVSETFESGVLGPSWTTYSSAANGRIQVTGANGTGSGSFALLMDSSLDGTYALNEAIWTVNLSGLTAATLIFQHTLFGDENEAMPTGNFTGHVDADGVAISSDGVTWRTIWSADSTTWTTPHTFDLAALASAAGMTPGANFQIKFQQYDNFAVTTDGRAWDNIVINTPSPAQNPNDYYRVTLAAGEAATIGLAHQSGPGIESISLLDAGGNVLATGSSYAAGLSTAIPNFVAPSSGSYFVRVNAADASEYNLIVTRSSVFDIEPNDTPAQAQQIGPSGVALGYVERQVSGVEPDNYTAGTVLTSVVSGITLSATNTTTAVTALVGTGSTGANVFGRGTTNYWNSSSVMLRADFSTPVSSVSIDLIPNDSSDPGVMQAYSAAGVLLQEITVPAPALGSFTKMTITRPGADIAYIQAAGLSGDTALLDNLVVNGMGQGHDYYSIVANAGDNLVIKTLTPGDGPGEFVNNLDPKIELYGPTGVLIAGNDNGGPDGRNPLLNHTATVGGEYTVRVLSGGAGTTTGEYVLSVVGATGLLPPFNVTSSSIANGAVLVSIPTEVTLTLNDNVLPSSVQASDLLVDGLPATSVTVVDGRTVRFAFPAMSNGPHTLAIASGAMHDLQQTPLQAFASSFSVDFNAPRVISSSIQEGDVGSPGSLTYTVGFSKSMLTTNLDSSDFTLRGNLRAIDYTATTFSYNPAGTVLTLSYPSLPEDSYTLTLLSGAGRFEDGAGLDLDGEPVWPIPPNQSGNGTQGGNFVVNFGLDVANSAYPGPLIAIDPIGSLVYDPVVSGVIATIGDTDTFSLSLDAGQKLTVFVDPPGSLRPAISVLDPSNAVIASASATSNGFDALLQNISITAAGTYKLVVSGVSNTTGLYSLQAVLNAAVEPDYHNGATNSTLATAMEMDSAMVALGGTASRAAVLGRTNVSDNWYKFNLAAGESATVGLRALSAGTLNNIELRDGSNNLLALGSAGGINLTQAISNFISPSGGTYYVHVNGALNVDYNLLVLRNAGFDQGGNATRQTAQPISTGQSSMLGAIQTSTGAGRLYTYDATNNQIREVNPQTGAIIRSFVSPVTTSSGPDFGMATTNNSLLVGGVNTSPIYELNLDTGATIRTIANPNIGISGMAFLNNEIYALTDSVSGQITVFNYTTGAVARTITASPVSEGIGASGSALYGHSGSSFYQINPATGGATLLGSLTTSGEGVGVIGTELFISEVSSIGVYDLATRTRLRTLTGFTNLEAIGADGGTAGAADDYYSFTASAGQVISLSTGTPGDGPFELVNTFNPRLRLLDASGNVLASDDNSAPDGRNAAITFAVPSSGTYYIHVASTTAVATGGEYVLNISGASLTAPAFAVSSTSIANGAVLTNPVAQLTVDFNDSFLVSSLQAGDLTLDGVPATGFTIVDSDSVTFNLPAHSNGLHTLAIAGGALLDLQQTGVASFSSTFTLDFNPPTIVSSSIQESDVRSPGALTYTVGFSKPMLKTNLDATDFSLRGNTKALNYTASSFVYDALGMALTLTYTGLPEDSYTLTLLSGDGRFEDSGGINLDGEPLWPIPPNKSGNGTAGGDFLVNFSMDIATTAFPTPLIAKSPAASLVYDPIVSGVIGAPGDIDSFTINLDPAQTATVVIDAVGTFRPMVELLDPSNTVIATAQASANGFDALLQTAPVAVAGTYTIRVSGVAGSTGGYSVQFILNAAKESESHNGPTNDTRATAQNINPSFINLANTGATRGAVLGSLPTGGLQPLISDGFESGSLGPAWSTYTSAANGRIQVSGASGTGSGSYAMLMDSSLDSVYALNEAIWTVDLTGLTAATLTFQHHNFSDTNTAMPTGNYTGHVNADGVSISADGVTWRAIWNADSSAFATTQTFDLAALASTAGMALGPNFQIRFQQYDNFPISTDGRGWDNITISTPVSSEDWYSFSATTGQKLTAVAARQASGSASIALFNAAGTQLASGVSGAANVDSHISSFTVSADGTYYIRVTGSGEYNLLVNRDAAFDLEPNNAPNTAQNINNQHTVLGSISGAGAATGGVRLGLIQDSLPWSQSANNTVASQLGYNLTLIPSSTLATVNFSNFDIVLLAGDQTTTVYNLVQTNMPRIESWVNAGGTWITTNAAGSVSTPYGYDLLPGAAGVTFNGVTGTDINVVAPTSGLLNGPGGVITSTTLDNGTSSTHGYTSSVLPAGATAILSTGSASQVVAFDYPFGAGHVVTHTIPVEYYAAAGNFAIFHKNLFNFGAAFTVSDSDYYTLTLAAGETVQLRTSTPGDGPGEFVNVLDPALELLAPNGTTVLSSNNNGAVDGRNAVLSYTAGAAGTYFVRVYSSATGSAAKGEYLLSLNRAPGAVADTAPPVLEDNAVTINVLGNDTDSDADVLSVVSTTAPAHGSVVINPDGSITYTPTADYHGADNFTYTINDGRGGTSTAAVAINVTPVNDAPSFTAGANQLVDEDAGAQSISNWATALFAGPNESGQSLHFVVGSDNPALFATQPAIAPDGTLTFTAAPNANGVATVTVYIVDDGGDLNGGDDSSPSQTFTISVSAVNDDPTFVAGPNQTVFEDAPAQTIAAWATSISPGPADEAAQVLSFVVSNDNNALFAVQPSVDPSTGSLKFTPTPNAHGSSVVSIELFDDEGGASGVATFTITVTPVNDLPTGSAAPVIVLEDGTVPIQLIGSDLETPAGALRFKIVSLPSRGVLLLGGVPVTLNQIITGSPTQLVYASATGYEGIAIDTFHFTVLDNGDPNGAANGLSSAPIPVEVSILPTIGMNALSFDRYTGLLKIGGHAGNDVIDVRPSGSMMRISQNGSLTYVTLSEVKEIRVWGRDGNDRITIAYNVPTFISGGAGNDTISATGADAVLLGGAGNDTLTASVPTNAGSLLIGGAGLDKLTGGSGKDVLVGGSVNPLQTIANLRAISAGWATSGSPFATTPIGAAFRSGAADTEKDTLSAGSAADWLIANPSSFDQLTIASGDRLDTI